MVSPAGPPEVAGLWGCLGFHWEVETPSDTLIMSIFVSTLRFWQHSAGSWENTFFSTIFNVLLFIKLSSSLGGLKQTWPEPGKHTLEKEDGDQDRPAGCCPSVRPSSAH